jgi:hypothetical protein
MALRDTTSHLWIVRLRQSPWRDDRGDVPGWVLITVMTAGLVGALWAVAGDRLEALLQQALSSVGG